MGYRIQAVGTEWVDGYRFRRYYPEKYYLFFNKRDAVRDYRETYGLKHKRVEIRVKRSTVM